MNYPAIIFDLDGTLLDTIDDLANAMNWVLAKHGLPTHSTEQYKTFVGNGMDNLTRRVLPTANDDEAFVQSILQAFQKQYQATWHDCTKPYPGIEEMLRSLETLGVRIAVLSNKSDPFTRDIIDWYFGIGRFEQVFGARSGVPKKPDPQAALEIAGLMDLPASSFLYLGDSGVDMLTANSAGMHALGATWGFRTVDELITHGVKRLIYEPMEICELVRTADSQE